ncbi:hypothetical protein ILYODFUR_010456 [Ilyodon furcidens]|uniref:Uncharacterized protein n=1 Tax=Ilyodon furcidens TaxID=33524 RepID=A0ABV0U492_9TELE
MIVTLQQLHSRMTHQQLLRPTMEQKSLNEPSCLQLEAESHSGMEETHRTSSPQLGPCPDRVQPQHSTGDPCLCCFCFLLFLDFTQNRSNRCSYSLARICFLSFQLFFRKRNTCRHNRNLHFNNC